MAVTYPRSLGALTYLYVYDTSAASWSSNRAGVTTHDLFPDDATVNDAIYFSASMIGNSNPSRFSGLSINVGTPLAATSITVAWEYRNVVTATWDALTVVDNTNAFQNSGVNTVLFVPPMAWGVGYSSTDPSPAGVANKLWIRCRITAASGLTEGGAVGAAVQKMDARVVVTGTTGALMTAVYAASVAGSWGVITRQQSFDGQLYYYQLAVDIRVGDGSTATTAYIGGCVIEIPDGILIDEAANGVLTIGYQMEAPILVFKMAGAKSYIIHSGEVVGACVINQHTDFPGPIVKPLGSAPGLRSSGNFDNGPGLMTYYSASRWPGLYGTRWDATAKARAISSMAALYVPPDAAIVRAKDTLYVSGTVNAKIENVSVTVSNVALSVVYSDISAAPRHVLLINVTETSGRDMSAVGSYSLYNGANSIYRCWPFRVRVTDSSGNPISGATVTVTDGSGTGTYGFNSSTLAAASGPLTTDASGYTALVYLQQYRFYYAAGTGFFCVCDARQDFAPYQVSISAGGYPTVTAKGIPMDSETRLTVTLASTGGVIVIED